MSTTRRGRPPLAWLTANETTALPHGTAVSVETHGRHTARTVGRIASTVDNQLGLDTPRGEVRMDTAQIKRARIVPALYEPGDPVLLRHVPAAEWRGGVVRTAGTDVLVEQIDGTFAWHAETDLEPADARDPAMPTPARAS
jgi:hypothetical protein